MTIRRVYETTIILNAAQELVDTEAAITKITTYMTNHGAHIEEIDRFGKRNLAYVIDGRHSGFYIHIVYTMKPSELPSLERYLTLEDSVLRHLTLLLEPELREYRKTRSLEQGNGGETILSGASDSDKYQQNTNVVLPTSVELPQEIIEEAAAIREELNNAEKEIVSEVVSAVEKIEETLEKDTESI